MKYRNYTIEKSINFAGYEFIHNDYCGASDSGFTVGLANSEQDAKEQIDEMEDELSDDSVVEVFVELGNYFKPKGA